MMDWTTINGTSVIDLGDRRIIFGTATARVPSGSPERYYYTLPVPFSTSDGAIIAVTCQTWIGDIWINAWVSSANQLSLVIHHNFGQTVDLRFGYIAIGQK